MSARETLSFLIGQLRYFRSDQPGADKPAFWLGAGCSVHDGVPLNNDLLSLVVHPDPDAWGSLQFRFDRLCDAIGSGPARVAYLEPHLKRTITPDSPYHRLVRLLDAGFADMVFTFNIDNLLEQALRGAGLEESTDYLVVNVPVMQPAAVSAMLAPGYGPRIRIVKMHGGFEWGLNNMTSAEITSYPEIIRRVVGDWSSRSAVVCGYSFFHLNVLEAFSRTGGPVVYANTVFPDAPMVLSLMAARNTTPLFVDGDAGDFGRFLEAVERGGTG